jgi:hypothetical protein
MKRNGAVMGVRHRIRHPELPLSGARNGELIGHEIASCDLNANLIPAAPLKRGQYTVVLAIVGSRKPATQNHCSEPTEGFSVLLGRCID